MDNWSPCFEIVDAFHLAIAANNEAGLELLEGTVRKALASENPLRRKNLDATWAFDQSSSVDVRLLEGFEFGAHGLEVFGHEGTREDIFVAWVVGVILGELNAKDHWIKTFD